MKRYYYLFTFLIYTSSNSFTWGQNASAHSLPNIIYILVDDLGYGDIDLKLETLDAFNNPNIYTPNLARLAQESLVFTNHYSAAPVCSPSRAGLLTGRTPTRSNIHLYINDLRENDKYFLHGNEITIAELLKSKGYQTAIFGKWHLNGSDWEVPANWTGWTGSFPKQQGFDHGIVSKEDPHFTRKLRVNTQKHPGDFFTVDGQPLGPIKGYSSDIISKKAIQWIHQQKDADAPFFAFLSYDAVHIRIAAADKYEALYHTGNARKDAYYANITHLDAAIGEVLDALQESGQDKNTILFFSSDNGPDVLGGWDATYFCYGTSYPLMGEKYQLYEGGIRVPGMVRWPGVIQTGISDEPNSTLDVLPSLAELTGIKLPAGRAVDGESILPLLLKGEPISRNRPLYWQFEHHREYLHLEGEGYERRILGPERSEEKLLPRVKIREGDYTLHGLSQEAFSQPTDFRLYHVKEDPEEKVELSASHPQVFASMREKLLQQYGDVQKDNQKTQKLIEEQLSTQAACRLSVDSDARFLTDQSGNPIFLHGDTGWNLGIKLTHEQIGQYLNKRKAQKFNIIGMAALFEQNTTNVYGDIPFEKTNGKWNPSLILETPGNNVKDSLSYDYWDHIDYAVSEIKKRDMYLAFVICFNAMIVGNGRGQRREQIVFDEEKAYEYGYFMGNRYKNEDHIIWMMGGDRSPVYGEHDYQPIYHAMAEGVADGIKGSHKRDGKADYSGILMSYHPQKARPASSTWFHQAEWLSFNSIQACPADQMRVIENDLQFEPQKPTWLFEGRYEEYTFQWRPWQMRFQAYVAIMSGAFGHLYGNRYIWNYTDEWKRHMDDPGTLDMVHLYDLFNTHFPEIPWGSLQPYDQLLLEEDLGQIEDICWRNATVEAPKANILKAMLSKNKAYAVIYSANGRSFELNINEFSGKLAEAHWYDPRTGHWFNVEDEREYAQKQNFLRSNQIENKERLTFDPPGEPGNDNDWILVIVSDR